MGDEIELSDGFYSVSDIQDYVNYTIKNETLPTNPPIHIHIKRINNRLVFKIIEVYKLEVQTTKTRRNTKQIMASIIKMKHKISKLLNDLTASKFVKIKLIEVNDLSSHKFSINKNIRLKTPKLRTDCVNIFMHILL